MDFVDATQTPVLVLEVVAKGPPGPVGPPGRNGDLTQTDFLLDRSPTGPCALVLVRTAGVVSSLTWTAAGTGRIVKRVTLNRTAGAVSSIVTQLFAPDGVTVTAQTTATLARSGGSVTSMATTRDI